MARKEAASFAVDVTIIVVLAVVYVAGLTLRTLLAPVIRVGKAMWPPADREPARYTH